MSDQERPSESKGTKITESDKPKGFAFVLDPSKNLDEQCDAIDSKYKELFGDDE
jgi:hypothetical protein